MYDVTWLESFKLNVDIDLKFFFASPFFMKYLPHKIIGSPAFVRVFVHQYSLLSSLWVYIFSFLIIIDIDNQACVSACVHLLNYCFDISKVFSNGQQKNVTFRIRKSKWLLLQEKIAKKLKILSCLLNGRVRRRRIFLQDISRTHNICKINVIHIQRNINIGSSRTYWYKWYSYMMYELLI